MLIVLGGLPEPQVNYILREQNGEWSSRFDLCYSDLKLIVEYDGCHHAEVRANWLNDIKRREALERDGWRFVIVTSEGLYEAPFETLQRVRLALIERELPRPVRSDSGRMAPDLHQPPGRSLIRLSEPRTGRTIDHSGRDRLSNTPQWSEI